MLPVLPTLGSPILLEIPMKFVVPLPPSLEHRKGDPRRKKAARGGIGVTQAHQQGYSNKIIKKTHGQADVESIPY